MDRIILTLENRGLYTPQLVEAFAQNSQVTKIKEVREELQASLGERTLINEPTEMSNADGDTLSAFNFLASASLRGESCSALDCRLTKLATLSRYAALYCDRVAIPVQFEPLYSQDEEDVRYDFYRDMVCVLDLRPLIESGIVFLVPSFLGLCPKCVPRFVPKQPEIMKVAREMAHAHAADFRMFFKKEKNEPGCGFTIKGPSKYLEHGRTYQPYKEKPAWFPTTLDKSRVGRSVEISQDLVSKSGCVEDIFDRIAEDATLQQFYGARYETKYLTDRRGEAEFISSLNAACEMTKQAKLCANLAHSIPLLSDAPLDTIVRIRREDHGAFQQYRSTLGEIVRKYVASGKDVSEDDARHIFLDELEPSLRGLERKAKLARKEMLKKSATKLAATSLVVGLGIYCGLLPAQLIELFKAVGGVKLASDLADTFSSVEKHSTEIRNHNLYFLLRVKEEMQG